VVGGCRYLGAERNGGRFYLIYFNFSLLRDISYVFYGCVSAIFVLVFSFFFQQIFFQQTLRRDLERPNRWSRDQRGGRFSIIEHESRHRIPSRTWTRMPDYLWTLDNYNSRQEINKSRARRTHPVSLFHSHPRPAGRTLYLSLCLSLSFPLSLSFCLCWCLFCRLKDLPADDLVDHATDFKGAQFSLANLVFYLALALPRTVLCADSCLHYFWIIIDTLSQSEESLIERDK